MGTIASPFRQVVIPVFSRPLRVLLLLVVAVTIASEIIPIPGLHPVAFYFYKSSKGLLFLLLGAVTPLALWRFDSMNRGLIFAASSAILVEASQTFIPGHRFSLFELLAKLVLILIGFIFAMNVLFERKFRIFGFQLRFESSHLTPRE
jgi:hypothetical protein